MELWNPRQPAETLHCLVRRRRVAALPEEIVRQHVLKHLVELGFPLSLIVVEMSLEQMPHISSSPANSADSARRADIVCFAKDIHPLHSLYPLLLVECKAVKLTSKTLTQVTGYNHFLKAHFIAVANQKELRTGWFDPVRKAYTFVEHLPSYSQMISSISKSNT